MKTDQELAAPNWAEITASVATGNIVKMDIEIVDSFDTTSQSLPTRTLTAAPWTVKLSQFIVLDTELLDYVCTENERDAKHLVGK